MKTLFTFLFILLGNLLIAQDIIVIKNENEVIDISKSVVILENTDSKLGIQDILKSELQSKFTKNKENFVNLKYNISNTWIKFSLQNMSGKELFLEIGEFSIPYIELYIPKGINNQYEVKKFGSSFPIKNKEIATNFYLSSLLSSEDSIVRTFYIRFQHQIHHKVPLKISHLKNFFPNNHDRDMFFGSFLGAIIIMALYNFFIYLVIKEIVYFYYVLHILMSGLASLALVGYGFNIFWANFPQINQYIEIFIVTIPSICLIVFSTSFLETNKYAPWGHKGLFALVFIILANVFTIVINDEIGMSIAQILVLIICIYLFIFSIYVYIKGNKTARFYIVANTIFILGVIILILKINKIVPTNFFTSNTNIFGTALEILFFSFALADKIRFINSERVKAQKENTKLVERQKEMLEAKVKEKTVELEQKNAEMLAQNEELYQQQEELMSINEVLETTFKELKTTSDRLNKSIKYANQIQQVILPQKNKLDSFFSEHFITYLPKDIVSGDFYWFTKLEENKAIFVLADCTGHGVPGAFMSMIGNTLLHEITKTKNIHSPDEILLTLHQGIRMVLKQEESKNSDGMDISVCLFEKNVSNGEYEVTFSGAKSNVLYIKDSQVTQLDGDRISIGGFTERKREFTNQVFTLQEGDVIYFTSDGYIDQHNFERRRFSSAKFRELVGSIAHLSTIEQEQLILSTLKDYQRAEEQRDDISVVGIRL